MTTLANLAFSTCADGGLRLTLAGTVVICRRAGALWIPATDTLVVADLHLEKGSAYAARGQMLPPYDTGETLHHLESEVAQLNPARIVFLGDSFHDADADARLTDVSRQRLTDLARGRDLVWITGNHDAQLPHALPGQACAELDLAGLKLRHEPRPAPATGEVAGHLHPCARITGTAGRIRRRCFITDGHRMILPAFGAFTGGLNVRDPAIAGLFPARSLCAVMGAGRVYAVAGRALVSD